MRVIRGIKIGVKAGLSNYINSINIINLIGYPCKPFTINGLQGMIINVSRFNILND